MDVGAMRREDAGHALAEAGTATGNEDALAGQRVGRK